MAAARRLLHLPANDRSTQRFKDIRIVRMLPGDALHALGTVLGLMDGGRRGEELWDPGGRTSWLTHHREIQ